MEAEDGHLTDEQVVRFADREAPSVELAAIREHLDICPECRQRLAQFEEAGREFARLHRARQWEVASSSGIQVRHALYTAAALVIAIGVWYAIPSRDTGGIPRADLTPGAVRSVALTDVCSSRLADNGDVVPAVQRQVLAEYGVAGGMASAYEVDYLITPALGGSSDIKNLWPQPYTGSMWNAYVKDALEDRLRGMVCSGELDLASAQRELAGNWIAAYKKHFHTERPLAAHLRSRD